MWLAFDRYAQQLFLGLSPPLGPRYSSTHEDCRPTAIEQTALPCRSLAHGLCLLASIVHGFRRPEQDLSLRSTRPLRGAQESLVFHVHCNRLTSSLLRERPPNRHCRFHRRQDGDVQAGRKTDLGVLFDWSLRGVRPRLTPLQRRLMSSSAAFVALTPTRRAIFRARDALQNTEYREQLHHASPFFIMAFRGMNKNLPPRKFP